MRHGETEYHAQKRVLGRLDIGLNETGREQARLAATFFDDVELSAVYCSPLKRCRETARPVADSKGLDVVILDGLMEVDMGDWDGRPFKELFEEEGDLVGRWMQNPSTLPIPGGENFNAVRERVMGASEEITARHGDEDQVLIVSHGGPIRGMLSEALRLDLDNMFRMQIDLTSISAIRYYEGGLRGTAVVILMNDTTHLKRAG